jgi:hypothetical protein
MKMKKPKIKTPEWVLEGYNSEKEYLEKTGKGKSSVKSKGKTFKIKKCPKCKSVDVSVFLGIEEGKGKGEWECKKCKWRGRDILEEEVSEDEFLNYLEEMGDKE